MSSEIERLLAHNRAQTWTKADTEKVCLELKRNGLLIWDNIGQRWPYTMAYDFYRSHADTDTNTRAEATRACNLLAYKWQVDYEFVVCLLALGFLAQDTISQGFAMAMSLSLSDVVREPFLILYHMGVETPFWDNPIYRKEDE